MSKYDEMSDFQINMAVAECLSLRVYSCQDAALKCRHSSVLRLSFDGDIINEFNPCNNPNDAWPIIDESKIDIEWNQSIHGFNPSAIKYFKDENPVEVRHKNPLRAAMIVFLMTNEVKQCN